MAVSRAEMNQQDSFILCNNQTSDKANCFEAATADGSGHNAGMLQSEGVKWLTSLCLSKRMEMRGVALTRLTLTVSISAKKK